jgi:hypothetical protein
MEKTMEVKKLEKIGVWSLMKILMLSTFIVGVVAGLISFIVALFGAHVAPIVALGQFSGVRAGLINLIAYPLMFIFAGAVYGLVAVIPFNLCLKLIKGMTIKINVS